MNDGGCKRSAIHAATSQMGDQLLLALGFLGGKRSPYRVPVIDERNFIKGVISRRRILEVLVGRRGESLRARKGLKRTLMEPIYLFSDEAHNIFPEWISPDVVLQYMAENTLGHVFIVDSSGGLEGMVSEVSILNKLRGKPIGIKVGEVMRHKVYSTTPDATLLDVSIIMADRQIRRLPVAVEVRLMSIITATDILHHILVHSDNLESIPDDMIVADVLCEKVGQIMSRPVSISPDCDIGEAINEIVDNGIRGLPVLTSEGRLVGMISRIDLITNPVRTKGAAFLASTRWPLSFLESRPRN